MVPNALSAARAALAQTQSQDEAYWSRLAASLGLQGTSVSDAVASIADETAPLASVQSWRELVELHVATQEALGATEDPVAFPLVSVLPAKGRAPHPTVPQEEYDALLSRTSLGETQVGILPDGLAVVRNRAGTLWTLDLRPGHWGEFLWGLPAPVGVQTLTVLAQDEFLFVQRLDVASTFESYIDVWKRAPVRGHYKRIGQLDGQLISGSKGAIIEYPLALSFAGGKLAILRPDGSVALVNPETQALLSLTALPPAVQEQVSGSSGPICLDGESVLISVPGDVVVVDLSTGEQEWNLLDMLQDATVYQVHLDDSLALEGRGVLREAKLHPSPENMLPTEAIGKKENPTVQVDGATTVIATAKALFILSRESWGKATVLTLPPRPRTSTSTSTAQGTSAGRPFYGPAPQRGSSVSLCARHALWLTQQAPFLLALHSDRPPRVLTLWDGIEQGHTSPAHRGSDSIARYEEEMQPVIASLSAHQDWVPQAVLTRSAAYLLGTLRGPPLHADGPAQQTSMLVSWEFGASALQRVHPGALRHMLQSRLACGAPPARTPPPVEQLRQGLAHTHLGT